MKLIHIWTFTYPGIVRAIHFSIQDRHTPWLNRTINETDVCIDFGSLIEPTHNDTCLSIRRLDGTQAAVGASREGDIVIEMWHGRLGNNLMQFAHAVFAAKVSGRFNVITPPGGSVKKLFEVPSSVEIEPDEEFRARVECGQSWLEYFHMKCTGIEQADYKRALSKYLWPYRTRDVNDACEREASNTKRELVIHLRSGDLLDSAHLKSRFAPCSFFDVIVNQDIGFESVRVITEPDGKHPCLPYFAAKNASFQSESLAADACAVMHADHIGFFASSSFSYMLIHFNPNAATVYSPFGSCESVGDHHCEPNFQVIGARPAAQYVKYCIPGMDQVRRGRDKINWMKHYPKGQITRSC